MEIIGTPSVCIDLQSYRLAATAPFFFIQWYGLAIIECIATDDKLFRFQTVRVLCITCVVLCCAVNQMTTT